MMHFKNAPEVAATNPWLSKAVFSAACKALPLVSIDLMVTRPGHQGRELLLGLRKNRPAQGWWFTPGGRIRKNEPLAGAMRRLAHDEIGLNPEWLKRAHLLNACDHFYSDSAFDIDISTHYINLPHAVHLTTEEAQTLRLSVGSDSQHDKWQWSSVANARNDEKVHVYVRAVLDLLL